MWPSLTFRTDFAVRAFITWQTLFTLFTCHSDGSLCPRLALNSRFALNSRIAWFTSFALRTRFAHRPSYTLFTLWALLTRIALRAILAHHALCTHTHHHGVRCTIVYMVNVSIVIYLCKRKRLDG